MVNQAFTSRARDLGFIAVGFSQPERPVYFDFFLRWLRKTELGDLAYLRRNAEIRGEPERLLDGLRTVISLAYPYQANKPSTSDHYAVARYSTPEQEDYHLRLKRLGKQLCMFIRERFPESRSRICVDSAPILERSFAVTAGIGFVGKNNMLIIPGCGSYFFLAEILTTAVFTIPAPKERKNECGSCTRCIDRCPTGALKEPYRIDVSRCLSYLTIEAKQDIDEALSGKMGQTFFGCDACQEACPFNREGSPVVSLPPTDAILKMNEGDFQRTLGKSAFKRSGLRKLKRNISVVKY